MRSKNKVIFYALIIGLILYVLDAVIYYLVFADDYSFLQVFITAVPLSEIYNRLLMFVGVVIFGFIASGIVSALSIENEFFKHQSSKNSTVGNMDIDFVSSLSYQIRTPLNAIVGFSELLKDPNLSAQSKQTYISHINSSGNYLLQFVNNIVDISKIESNQINVNVDEFGLNELLKELSDFYNEKKLEMGRKDVDFRIDILLKNDIKIKTDKKRLKQVLENLLENAFKHTEEGFIELGYVIKEENLLEFFVKDTGRGYSMDRLEIIFKRYNKLSDNQNQPFDGAALRLTISKSLVKLLGGNIWANSKVGQGSTFYFTLPFKAVEKSIESSELSDPKEKQKKIEGVANWSQINILIAEDVESNYIYMRELLRPTKANLIWAKNGEEAVKEIKSNTNVDLVLMDILMPEMDGYEASKIIKQLRPNLPIIAQTAYSLESGRDNADVENFDDYLIKPIWSPQLMSALTKYLS